MKQLNNHMQKKVLALQQGRIHHHLNNNNDVNKNHNHNKDNIYIYLLPESLTAAICSGVPISIAISINYKYY